MAGIATGLFTPSVAQGMFGTTANGLRQGTAFPDPSTLWRLRGGIIASDETLPMWGGVGVYMNVPPVGTLVPNSSLGGSMGRATGLTGSKALAGFSVFDQNYAWVQSAANNVPVGSAGMQVNAYPLGSLARVVVACDATLVSLWNGPINPQVSWDYVNQRLVPFNSSAFTISSGSYNSTTGLVTLTLSATINIGPGDAVVVSSVTGTGTDLAKANGTFTTLAPTSGTTLTYQIATGLTISSITGGSVTPSGSGDALPVKVLSVRTGNNITVGYNATTQLANWVFGGACAVIQL